MTSKVNKKAVMRVGLEEWAKLISKVCDKGKVLLPTVAFHRL